VPRVCTVCAHPESDSIDRALVGGAAFRPTAAKYGVSDRAIRRHHASHVPIALARAQQAREVTHGDDLLGQLQLLQSRTLAILSRAEQTGQLSTALLAIREARSNLEFLAKLMGELQEVQPANVLQAPEWLMVRSILLAALARYPEARQDVAARLLALEGGRDACR